MSSQILSDESAQESPDAMSPADVTEYTIAGRRYVIVGAEHISGDSPGLIADLVERVNPDILCVDLDPARAKALSDETLWENLTLADVIREKLLTALILNLILASYSRKYGELKGGMPGTELYKATQIAEIKAIPVCFSERDINITFSRAWRSLAIVAKLKLFLVAILRLFRYGKAGDDDIHMASSSDLLSAFVQELTPMEPALALPLVEERDQYTAQKIVASNGETVLAVVGAGRIARIGERLCSAEPVDIENLESVTKTSIPKRIAAFAIPVLVIIAMLYLSLTQGKAVVRENIRFWVLANSLFTGIGAIVAGGHILTVLTAVVVAPFSPFIPAGPGTVAAIVQLLVRPPLVKDFQTFPEDLNHFRAWRKNRILRILLVMVLCGLGSLLGTILGTSRIILSLFGQN
jgi:pheromone shutdown-related protein TraB